MLTQEFTLLTQEILILTQDTVIRLKYTLLGKASVSGEVYICFIMV